MSEFVPVMALADLKEGEVVGARLNGAWLALYLVDGQPYCTGDICTHEDNLLSDGGFVEGEAVECIYHGARFSVKTGEVVRLPAVDPIRTYPVEVRDGQVFVAL